MVWVVCGLAAGCIILLLALLSRNDVSKMPELPSGDYFIIIGSLFAAFAFLLFYKSDTIPTPYHVDEAGMAYNAVALEKFHCDQFLYKFPVYLSVGQNALYTWLAAMMIRIFGYGVTVVRLPAIMLSLISALVFVLLIRSEYGNAASVTAMIAFCVIPVSIMHSRWGLESYLLFPTLTISFCCFIYALKSGKTFLFFLSGVLFGITLYSYAVSYMILPLFLGSVIIYLMVINKLNWKQLLVLAFPLALFAIPLLLMMAVNNGMIDEIKTRFFSIPRLVFYRGSEVSLKNILTNLRLDENNLFYSIFVRDRLIYNVIPSFGTVYYFNIPFIIYGFILTMKQALGAMREKRFTMNIAVLFLFVSVFAVLLFLPYANVNRACALFLPLIYFLAAGIYGIVQKCKTASFLYGGLCFLTVLSFVCYYFADFPKDLSYELSVTSVDDLKNALDFAEEINTGDAPVTIYGLSNPYIYTILVRNIDPFKFNDMKVMNGSNVDAVGSYRFYVRDVSPEQVYLVRTDGWVPEEIRQQDFNLKEFGTVTVYYP